MTRILHISADFPDPIAPNKTRAISNLLDAAAGFDHQVYSINRVAWHKGIDAVDFGGIGRAVTYGGPPKGIFLARGLDRLADWIAEDADRRSIIPDLIHAHKLSVEGLVAQRLAAHFRVPLVVSIQGDSDLKIIGAKRDLRARYRAIWSRAAVIFPFAPWASDRLSALLGQPAGTIRPLPCPAERDTVLSPIPRGPLLRTAFHLASHRRKNASALIRAVGKAAKSVPELRLEIIGGGDDRAHARLAAIARSTAPGRVDLLGPQPHASIPSLMNGACACPLISRRESFGMIFSEALLAGTPVLIPRGWGIDGYLAEGGVLLAADPTDEHEIADALIRLVREETAFKARLGTLSASGGLDFLRREAIALTYRDGIAEALAH